LRKLVFFIFFSSQNLSAIGGKYYLTARTNAPIFTAQGKSLFPGEALYGLKPLSSKKLGFSDAILSGSSYRLDIILSLI
jgi:hypothetical protein